MKIISNKYYFIREENKLVIYNVKEHRPEKLININRDILDRILQLNDVEVQVSGEVVYSKLMEKLYEILPFIIVEVEEDELNNILIIEKFINNYIEVHQNQYNLKEHMLRINLRNCVYFKKYYAYLDDKDFKITTLKNLEIRNEFQKDPYSMHIIDQSFFNNEKKRQIEEYAIKNKVQRIYFSENKDNIIIGPGLVGRDYGCLFCNDLQSEDEKTSLQAQQIIAAILQYELVNYDINMLSFSINDNTICKGKYFKISKLDFSGEDCYINRKSRCEICGGEYD